MANDSIKQFKLPSASAKPTPAKKPSLFENPGTGSTSRKRANVFGDDDDDDEDSTDLGRMGDFGESTPRSSAGQPGLGGPRPQTAPKRHFVPGSQGRKSGPGTLDQHLGPGLARRAPSSLVADGHGRLAFDDGAEKAAEEKRAAEKAAPNPTLHLASLFPRITQSAVLSLIPSTLKVEKIDIFDPNEDGSGRPSTARESRSAIVTLDKNTPARDIDAVVSSLQDRYLAFGYFLKISRGHSTAVRGSENAANSALGSSSLRDLPFGARLVSRRMQSSLNAVPPPNMDRGSYGAVPPPDSEQGSFGRPVPRSHGRPAPAQDAIMEVIVEPPKDIMEIRMINMIVERIVKHGPEFEALIMTRPEVQRNEEWAWIWDARSTGGVWYRWRLWQALTGFERGARRDSAQAPHAHQLFTDGIQWIVKEPTLPFEFATEISDIPKDPHWDPDEEHNSAQDTQSKPSDASRLDTNEPSYLNPKDRAKLVHLLTRLPLSSSKLRRGDVARITSFAVDHTSRGASEVADYLVENVKTPFNISPYLNPSKAEDESKTNEHVENSILVALFAVSDLLSSCANNRVFKAWTYRKLLEDRLKEQEIFHRLGRLAKSESLGRLRREKWKRSVGELLHHLEASNVFTPETHKLFTEQFNNPPLTAAEKAAEIEREERKKAESEKAKQIQPALSVTNDPFANGHSQDKEASSPDEHVDGEPIDDADGEPMPQDSDVDGEPMIDSDVDGEPMMDSDVDGEPMADSDVDGEHMARSDVDGESMAGSEMKDQENGGKSNVEEAQAEDMFAD